MKYYLAIFLLAVAVFVSQSESSRDRLTHRNLIILMYDISIEDTILGLTVAKDDALSLRNTTKGTYTRHCTFLDKDQEVMSVDDYVYNHQICRNTFYMPFNTLHEHATRLITAGNELVKNMTTAIENCTHARIFDSCFRPKARTFAELKRNYVQNSQRTMWDIYSAKKELFSDSN